MADSEYESVLCVKNEVFVYKIPARPSNRGYRAADWTLDKPDWVGRMKITSKGKDLVIRLEDKNNGELFAQCPVDNYPGIAVEQVIDSSRYFVIRIQDGSARKAFIGIGFADRGDSFDLLVAMQDHFKWVKREVTQQEEDTQNIAELKDGPKLDLGFKEGQTIRINLSTKRPGDENSPSHSDKPRSRGQTGGLLPPPGGSACIAAPPRAPAAVAAAPSPVLAAPSPIVSAPSSQNSATSDLLAGSQPQVQSNTGSSNVDLLFSFGSSSGPAQSHTAFQPIQPQAVSKPAESDDPWGAFASATGSSNQSNQQGGGWVNFE